jgi:uncharacterized protein
MAYTLITGASSGIGEEFARQYAKKGHSLILTARSKDKLEQLSKELSEAHKISIHIIPQDLSHMNSAEELHQKCLESGLEVNFLINNAGVGLIGKFESHEIHKIQEMLLLNILTLTKLCYLFLPQLKKNHGTLMNVASQVSYQPAPYMAAYGATKAYVLSLTQALRVELKDSQVKVVALCPGPTYTRFFERAHSNPDQINFKFRTPKEVVSEALIGAEKEKAIVVPGIENRVWTFMTRFIPKPWLAKMSQYTLKKKL